jgi:hypothetical protein
MSPPCSPFSIVTKELDDSNGQGTGFGGEFLGTLGGGLHVWRGIDKRVGKHKGNEAIHAQV